MGVRSNEGLIKRFYARMNLPTFIGIGGQKCASTWLSESLRQHPQVFMSSPKELRYFVDNKDKSLDWYRGHFKNIGYAKHWGEFSSNYIYYPETAALIKKGLGNIKIIAILREPKSRTLSHIKHLIRDARLPMYSGCVTADLLKKMVEIEPTLISHSLYKPGLRAYIEEFGRDNMLVLDRDDCLANGAAVEQYVWSFLGIEPGIITSNSETKVSAGILPRHVWLERLRQYIYKQAKRGSPHLINWVRSSGISGRYREWNRGGRLWFSDCAQKYISIRVSEEWLQCQKYLTFSNHPKNEYDHTN